MLIPIVFISDYKHIKILHTLNPTGGQLSGEEDIISSDIHREEALKRHNIYQAKAHFFYNPDKFKHI
jgi:hypothetical protein